MASIDDVKLINFNSFKDHDGLLVPIEQDKNIPFSVKRLYWIFGVKNKKPRGQHAHYETEQVFISLKGVCKVSCSDGFTKKDFELTSPFQGLYMPAMIWGEQIYDENTIVLVLASTFYDRDDYIEDWNSFNNEVDKEK